MHGLTTFVDFVALQDGHSNDWILGWDGFADKFHYRTWHDDEFSTLLLPTITSDVLTNPLSPCYSRKPDGSRSYNHKLPRRLLVTSPTLTFLIFGDIVTHELAL